MPWQIAPGYWTLNLQAMPTAWEELGHESTNRLICFLSSKMNRETLVLDDYFVSDPLSLIRIKFPGSRMDLLNAARRHVSHGYSCFATQKRHVPENVG